MKTFIIKMISKGELKIEGRTFIEAFNKNKARKKFEKLFPGYLISSIKEYLGEELDNY